MTDTNPLDALRRIAELARAATRGEWKAGHTDVTGWYVWLQTPGAEADARYISAAAPDVLIAIEEAVRELGDIERFKGAKVIELRDRITTLEAENRELKAEVARLDERYWEHVCETD